jgi:outer membrane protein OmpU
VNGADSGVDPTHFGLALGYTMDALTVAVNYGEYDEWVLRGAPDSEGFGLVVNYDLGGGAEAQFGYGSNDTGSAADEDTFSLGLALSF